MSTSATWTAAVELFNRGSYLAAHELFEELWEATESREADFYKGLIQASIALHHFQEGNLEGASRLYAGHRKLLARFLPHHKGADVARFLEEMQGCLRPVLAAGDRDIAFDLETRPRILTEQ